MNDIATLTPPQGWKLLNGSQKQRFINEHLSGAEDIIAIALPDGGDGSVFAQLSYRPAGYVDENIQIDPTRVRQGISEDLDMLNQESGRTLRQRRRALENLLPRAPIRQRQPLRRIRR